MTITTTSIAPERLRTCVAGIFAGCHVPDADARVVADSLVEADLRGVSSHGVVRVPAYVAGLRGGSINARPNLRVVVDTGARAVVDGDDGMGQVAANHAMGLAVERAREHGIGAVGLRRSRHCGAMAYWALQALAADCIGFATTNAGMNMAPTGGREKIVGNNPLAIAIPTNRPWPMVLDMATSVVAGGKLDVAAIRGQKIPLGWATDPDGQPTDDPAIARKGLLLPVGGPKGYGLAVMLDVLAGVLTGARFGGGLGIPGSGQFFLAIQVEGFLPIDEFRSRMDQLIDQIHQSQLAPGSERIYVQGEIEHELALRRAAEGIPLEAPIVQDLERLAQETGAPAPVSSSGN
ncbi:MAG TPA: Ldh family oxidoreductase [Chloroflexota bacterium]|nr:Ldh family oxidoreductase [Chloroflexota bacterium]